MSTQSSLSLKLRLTICWRVFTLIIKTRPMALVIFIIGALIEIASFIASMYASAKIVSILAAYLSTGSSEGIWLWFWIDVVAIISIAIGNEIMSYSKKIVYFRFITWSTHEYLMATSSADIAAFYEEKYRNELNKVSTRYYWQLSELAFDIMDLIYGLLRLLSIFILVSQIQWWIMPLIIILLIPSLIAESRLASTEWFITDKHGDDRHIIDGLEKKLRDAQSLMEVRILQVRTYILGIIDNLNIAFYKKQEKEFNISSRYVVLSSITGTIGTAVGSFVLIMQVLDKTIGFDRYLFLSSSLLRISGALVTIFGTLSRMQTKINFAESFFYIIDHTPKIIDKKSAIALSKDRLPEVTFENVSFSYPEKSIPVFKNLNLTIRPGEHVALVGENGAGKSTLIKLLLRLYIPTSGRILIDGKDIQEISIESWYEKIATLFQDFNQYPLSVEQNISIGRTDKKFDKIQRDKAARFGEVDMMVKKYKHGWHTVLDSSFKQGTEPSGGQWQRVALARAFYRDAQILILDEPTAAIDAKAEYDIFNNIFDSYKNRTALIVSHRFSTVRRAHRIIVLDKGSIVEQGSHEILMKKAGLYHELFTKQAEGYK